MANAKGHLTQLSFDDHFGQVATIVDPNGVAVQRSYDGFGMLSESRSPSGKTTYTYAALPAASASTPAGVTYPRLQVSTETRGTAETFGGRAEQQLDNYGRLVRSETVGFGGAAVIAEKAYDARGRLSGSSLPHLAGAPIIPSAAYHYDYLDRITQIEHSDGTFGERQYASGISLTAARQNWLSGLPCAVANPAPCGVDIELSIDTHAPGEVGKQNVIVRDHAGLVVRSIDGENVDNAAHTSNYEYAAFNRLRQMRDNASSVTVFDHDAYGRLKLHVDPDSGATAYTYNGFGELKTSIDPKQQLRTYSYDALGRLETIVDSAGTTRWIYDQGVSALGQLSESISPSTVENPAGQHVLYAYEPVTQAHPRGLVESVTYAIDHASYTIGMRYDDLARIDTIDYPETGSGAPIRAKYDYESTSGALVGLNETGSGTARPIWHINSAFQGHLVERETFGNGAVSSLTYDPDRRWLDSVRTTLGAETVQSLEYSHYDNGQVRERITPSRNQEYVYDPLGRLRTLTDANNNQTSVKQFGYDAFGNLAQNDTITNSYANSRHLEVDPKIWASS